MEDQSDDGDTALLAAIRAVAQSDTPQSRRGLYKALLASQLLVPTPGRVDPSEVKGETFLRLEGGSQISLITGKDPEGRPAIFAFTDRQALHAWRPEASRHLRLEARDLFNLARHNKWVSIILNPAGPAGGILTRPEFVLLADGMIPRGAAGEAGPMKIRTDRAYPALIGLPKKMPSEEFLEGLRRACSGFGAIEKAYIYQTSIEGGEPHLALAVDFDDELMADQLEVILEQFLAEIQNLPRAPEYFDVVVLEESEYAEAVRALGSPFFSR